MNINWYAPTLTKNNARLSHVFSQGMNNCELIYNKYFFMLVKLQYGIEKFPLKLPTGTVNLVKVDDVSCLSSGD